MNTGSSLTATLAGGMDDRGYVKINDTLYDNLGIDVNLGVSIQPRQVQLKRGANLIEIRTVNTGGGPTGVWLTITTNNNILVKTGCDGWKCTRFFYPQEVFHATVYNKTLADAPALCQRLGARVATYAELDEAQKNHANWCSTGWVSDKGDKNAFYPITYETIGGCGNGRSGIIDWIGDNNWFQRWGDKSGVGFKAGVNCFGNKPEQGAITRAILPDNTVMPYNKNQWSRYSPGTSPPVVTPPLPPVTINQHCGGAGWSRQLTGPKVFNSGADYPSDVSFIRVPAGVTVVISYNGRSFTIVGPNNFNACGANTERGWLGSGDWYFNDKMSTIDIRATGSSDATSLATPPPAPQLPETTLHPNCDGGGGWSTKIKGPGIFRHYDWARSQLDYRHITVPAGVTAILTVKTVSNLWSIRYGQVITLKGPTSLNLCSLGYGGGFKDNIATIETRAS